MRPSATPARATVALAATLACVLEASADKVGNVTPTRSFADLGFGHFVDGAAALGPAIAQARPGRVGWTIFKAVAAVRRVVPSNTHLGVALLLAPLAAAWMTGPRARLQSQVARVLAGLGTDDARWAYRAIRLARPGGLGRSEEADVRRPPTVTLSQAMALAAHRDTIAAEYVRGFGLTFTVVLPALRRAIRRGLSLLEAIAQAHLELLATVPDTLIARKRGRPAAEAISARAQAALRRGGLYTRAGRRAAARLDTVLRLDGNRLNPGTSADLIAASLFIWLLDASSPGGRAMSPGALRAREGVGGHVGAPYVDR